MKTNTQQEKKIGFYKFWKEEARNVMEKDPAATSMFTTMFFHPGVKARMYHYIAHKQYVKGRKSLAHIIAYRARRITGIEIHPGAKMGRRTLIDHGSGLVIGETAVVGDDCVIYHGVTLGGVSTEKGAKRHPTVGNNVLLGAGAIILGDVTIGDNAKIGAGAIVFEDIASGATAVGHPAREIIKKEKEDEKSSRISRESI